MNRGRIERKHLRWWMLGILWWIGWMPACVKPPADPAVLLRQRAEAFWAAREAGRQTVEVGGVRRTLYEEFLWSGDKREITESEFARRTSMRVRNVSIEDVQIVQSGNGKPIHGTVTVRFDTPAKFGAWFKGVRVKQKWIFENGTWRVEMSPDQNPFRRKLI